MNKLRSGFLILVLFSVFIFTPFPVNAALEYRGTDSLGYQLFYDTDFNITWYDYSPNATWWSQSNTVSTLTVDIGGTIYDGWRLPTALNQDGSGPCSGSDCTSSELGHLFYTELGNDGILANFDNGPFENLTANNYWFGTQGAGENAWYFAMGSGGQATAYKGNTMHLLAVRSGDIAVVPEPISSTLFIVGGATLGFRRFRKKFHK